MPNSSEAGNAPLNTDIPKDFGLGKSYDEIIAILKESFGVDNTSPPLYKLFGFPYAVKEKSDNYARVYAIRGHIAAATGDVARLQAFINETSDINTTTRDGIETKMPWIHAAVLGGQPETLKLLLDREASATAKYEAEDAHLAEPIHSLAIAHWTAKWPERFDVIINMLLSAGAQIDAQNRVLFTALGLAMYKKHIFNAEGLLRGGADPSKDAAFAQRFASACFDHAHAARAAYRNNPDFTDALSNPELFSKPGSDTEVAKCLVRIARQATKNTQDEPFLLSLIQTICSVAYNWPQPYLASAQAMVGVYPNLGVLGLEAACNTLDGVWSQHRDIVQLEALHGLVKGLVASINPEDDPELIERARNLLAAVAPTHYRIVFAHMGSFSLFGLRQCCGLYERQTIEVDVTTPLWKLEDVMRQTFPSLHGRHVEFRADYSPHLGDPKQRNVSLLAHKFRDNGVVFVTSANQPPMPPVESPTADIKLILL